MNLDSKEIAEVVLKLRIRRESMYNNGVTQQWVHTMQFP